MQSCEVCGRDYSARASKCTYCGWEPSVDSPWDDPRDKVRTDEAGNQLQVVNYEHDGDVEAVVADSDGDIPRSIQLDMLDAGVLDVSDDEYDDEEDKW